MELQNSESSISMEWKGESEEAEKPLRGDAVLQVRGRCGMRKERAEVREAWEWQGWEASADSLVPHISLTLGSVSSHGSPLHFLS